MMKAEAGHLGLSDCQAPAASVACGQHSVAGVIQAFQEMDCSGEDLSSLNNGVIPRHVKRAEEYIAAHLAEDLDNLLLARIAEVSPRSLYRGFVLFRGMSPARYIQDMRLEVAHREVIASGSALDMKAIAASNGFRSYASFWRSYVRKFGAPPSHIRKDLRRRRKRRKGAA